MQAQTSECSSESCTDVRKRTEGEKAKHRHGERSSNYCNRWLRRLSRVFT